MKKIKLFKVDSRTGIIYGLDFDLLDDISKWLLLLPLTKRRKIPYKFHTKHGSYEIVTTVVFARAIDATAFRLKFGL